MRFLCTVLMHVPSHLNPIIVTQEYQVPSELPSVLEVLTSYVCLDASQCVFLECSSYASWDACQAKQLASLTLCSSAVVTQQQKFFVCGFTQNFCLCVQHTTTHY